jgi:cobalt-zinc-cadmium efflux system membrane fusion protein
MKLFLPVCLVFALFLAGCGPARPSSQAPPTRISGDTVIIPTNSPQCASLVIETVGTEEPTYVPLTGRLVWNEDETVRVFTPFAGIVRKLFVDVNQPVTTGAPLAEIQSPEFGQAQTEARKAESDFRRTELNLNRLRDLFEHGAAPRKDLEAAEADFASARAERDRCASRLAIYGAKPGEVDQDFVLPSPLTGILVERNVTFGQEIRPDQMLANVPQFTQPLFVVTNPKRLWVWLDMTESQLPLVRKGQQLRIHSTAYPDRVFDGRLDLIGNSLDPATRTVRARGSVDNSSELLKAELYVTTELPDANPVTLQVPSKAVFLRGDQHYVFVEKAAGQYQLQPVQLGREREGKFSVLGGLKSGQRLVTEGCLLLQSLLDQAPKS